MTPSPAGDSYNDLGMIQASKAGFLFKSTEQIKADHPELPAYEEFDDLLAAIRTACRRTRMTLNRRGETRR